MHFLTESVKVTFATPPSDHCGCSRNEDENSNEEDGVHADRYGGKKVERKIFGPKPNIAWDVSTPLELLKLD